MQLKKSALAAAALASSQLFLATSQPAEVFSCVGTNCADVVDACLADSVCAIQWNKLVDEMGQANLDVEAIGETFDTLFANALGKDALECSVCKCTDELEKVLPLQLVNKAVDAALCNVVPISDDATLALNCTINKCSDELTACSTDGKTNCPQAHTSFYEALMSEPPSAELYEETFTMLSKSATGKSFATCMLCECQEEYQVIIPENVFDSASQQFSCNGEPPAVTLPELECGSKTCSAEFEACKGSLQCMAGLGEIVAIVESGKVDMVSLAKTIGKLMEDSVSKTLLECLGCKCESDFDDLGLETKAIKALLTCEEPKANSPSSGVSLAASMFLSSAIAAVFAS